MHHQNDVMLITKYNSKNQEIMKRKIKAGYVAPEVLVVQLKTNGSLLTMSEDTSKAASMDKGSFGARGGSFSTWESNDEE